MPTLIFDAGPLITSCKFTVDTQLVIDHFLQVCTIIVPNSVRDEVVIAGSRYADAKTAKQRMDSGKIIVLMPPASPEIEPFLEPYGLGVGERDSILLTTHKDLADATLVIDDHLAYLVSDRLRRPQKFLLDTIIDFVQEKHMESELAIQIVQAIQPRYPHAFVEHTLRLLRR